MKTARPTQVRKLDGPFLNKATGITGWTLTTETEAAFFMNGLDFLSLSDPLDTITPHLAQLTALNDAAKTLMDQLTEGD